MLGQHQLPRFGIFKCNRGDPQVSWIIGQLWQLWFMANISIESTKTDVIVTFNQLTTEEHHGAPQFLIWVWGTIACPLQKYSKGPTPIPVLNHRSIHGTSPIQPTRGESQFFCNEYQPWNFIHPAVDKLVVAIRWFPPLYRVTMSSYQTVTPLICSLDLFSRKSTGNPMSDENTWFQFPVHFPWTPWYGVSTIGLPPKWIVFNGKSHSTWMIRVASIYRNLHPIGLGPPTASSPLSPGLDVPTEFWVGRCSWVNLGKCGRIHQNRNVGTIWNHMT